MTVYCLYINYSVYLCVGCALCALMYRNFIQIKVTSANALHIPATTDCFIGGALSSLHGSMGVEQTEVRDPTQCSWMLHALVGHPHSLGGT